VARTEEKRRAGGAHTRVIRFFYRNKFPGNNATVAKTTFQFIIYENRSREERRCFFLPVIIRYIYTPRVQVTSIYLREHECGVHRENARIRDEKTRNRDATLLRTTPPPRCSFPIVAPVFAATIISSNAPLRDGEEEHAICTRTHTPPRNPSARRLTSKSSKGSRVSMVVWQQQGARVFENTIVFTRVSRHRVEHT